MKVLLILVGLIAVVTLWMISHAADWDPSWDEPLWKEDDKDEP